MVRSNLTRRWGVVLTATALSVTAVGCGDKEKPAEEPQASASSAESSGGATPTASPSQEAASSSPLPKKQASDLPKIKGAKVVRIPKQGPVEARGFPVPPWIKGVKSPGAIEKSWQFDIPTNDTDRVVAFYEKVLPRAGYQVRKDVKQTIGLETNIWDVVFDKSDAHGALVADPAGGVVFVEVRSEPWID